MVSVAVEAVVVTGVLIAVFTGLTVVVTWRAHRHDRALSGYVRPIQARRREPSAEVVSGLHNSGLAAGGIRIWNRSDYEETVRNSLRVLWPRGCEAGLIMGSGEVRLGARKPWLVSFHLRRSDGQPFTKRHALVVLSVERTSGKRQRFLRRVEARRGIGKD